MGRPPSSAFLNACHMSQVVRVVAVVNARALWRAAHRMLVLVAIGSADAKVEAQDTSNTTLQQNESHVTGEEVGARVRKLGYEL